MKNPQTIDADVHAIVPSIDKLRPYMSDHWRAYVKEAGFRGPTSVGKAYPPFPGSMGTQEANGKEGSRPDLGQLRRDVLDPLQVKYAVLNCFYGVEAMKNADFAAELARAVNDWVLAEWLDKEPRLLGSIVVPSEYPDLAVREIERRAADPRYVQIFLPVRSERPYGTRRYNPIFEAAQSNNLVVCIHFGGTTGYPSSPSGWPNYYIDEYVGMALTFQSQVVSLIAEGVFDIYADLRVLLAEGGFAWVPSLMWRMDKDWKGLRREIPWVKERPSEYLRRHFRATIQPPDIASNREALLQIIDQIGSDEFLVFATDHPHAHDSGVEALVEQLPEQLQAKIRWENAESFYGLEERTKLGAS